MDTSSDGSFAWTDASNDTIDSEAMVNNSTIKTHSEDESVSGKIYKKKLQKELFVQSNGSVEDEKQLTPKERKRKLTEGQSGNEHASPKKKKIKREPESDIDVSATKHKTNGHNHSESHDSYDESYLDLKVKAEQQFVAPLVKIKKKKKKSKTRDDSFTSEMGQESLLERDRVAEDGNHSPTLYAEESDANITPEVETLVHNAKIRKSKSSQGYHDQCQQKDTDTVKDPDLPCNSTVSLHTLKSMNRSPRITERIQFEEDESSEMETSQPQSSPSTKSSKLKTFLKNNINLKPFSSILKTDSVLTSDDEIWIVRCPKDVNIDDFQNKDLMLEGKCKLKLNGQTYEGVMDDACGNMSMLTSEHNNYVIKSLSVKGCLNLRKRIPKPHILEEATLCNQSNFIPLPETKCRHPLFGSNYRKAIKIGASVAERLRAPLSCAADTPRAHKTRKMSQVNHMLQHESSLTLGAPKAEPTTESLEKPSLEMEQPVISKKKKRKHLNTEEIAPKKKKRIKHDLESAEAWESEKAIEENLFNF